MITKIQLKSLTDANRLIDLVCQINGDAYLHYTRHGKYTMTDAKSYPEVLALNIEQPLLLVSENEWLHKKLRRFVVNQ